MYLLKAYIMSGPRSGQNQGEGSQLSLADNQAAATALKICLPTLPKYTIHTPCLFSSAECM